VPHEFKTYHLKMEPDGTVIVSTRIWERISAMHENGGFEAINVVADPPGQNIKLEPVTLDLRPADLGAKKKGA
jgi:hypothetical protein